MSTQEDATGSHHSFSACIQLFYELNANFSAVLFFAIVVCWQMLHCGVALSTLWLCCSMGFGCNGDVMFIYFCSFFCSNSAFNQEIDPVIFTLTMKTEWLSYFEYTVQSLLNTNFSGIRSWVYTKPHATQI